ncbi:hypothetical protein BJ138DRAFT_318950 [Hygrophoropsis aurantiaca]|uniref:Uncharacterized protein n=1 Tax=Hygrophoropsis aurantiaca TaxID=72124 RepID=A0ACB8A7X4_9AGAM|nr:hypothetical protein BJ138DRAFT_318950 [Hygrophoropsis aurantiaca]
MCLNLPLATHLFILYSPEKNQQQQKTSKIAVKQTKKMKIILKNNPWVRLATFNFNFNDPPFIRFIWLGLHSTLVPVYFISVTFIPTSLPFDRTPCDIHLQLQLQQPPIYPFIWLGLHSKLVPVHFISVIFISTSLTFGRTRFPFFLSQSLSFRPHFPSTVLHLHPTPSRLYPTSIVLLDQASSRPYFFGHIIMDHPFV